MYDGLSMLLMLFGFRLPLRDICRAVLGHDGLTGLEVNACDNCADSTRCVTP